MQKQKYSNVPEIIVLAICAGCFVVAVWVLFSGCDFDSRIESAVEQKVEAKLESKVEAKVAAVMVENETRIGKVESEITAVKQSSGRDTNSTTAFIIAIAGFPVCIIVYLVSHRFGFVRHACDRLKGKKATVSE